MFLDLHPDWRVLAFTAGLAILTCILFGLLPAIQAARTPPGEVMKTNSRSLTSGRERFSLRRALVVSQVALSLVLLIGALLFVSTFRNLLGVNAGLRQDGILVVRMDLSPLQLPVKRRNAYKAEVLERIRAIPGVISAASIAIVPLSGGGWNENISIPDVSVKRAIANFNQASAGYFQTVQTPMLVGRDFDDNDTAQSPPVAIITETFAKKFLSGKNPVGMTFRKARQGKPVTRRRNEIGIRMALGADKQSILSMIMREAASLLVIGLAIGTVLALIAGSTARALLFGTKPTDPLTLSLAVAGLAAVAAAASFLPARRASTLDPMNALREE